MLSKIPAKPMVPKAPTPPVQKIENLATFEPSAPLAKGPPRYLASHEIRTSEVVILHARGILTNLARCPARAHILLVGHAHHQHSCVIWPSASPTCMKSGCGGSEFAGAAGRGIATKIPSRQRQQR